PLGDARKVRLTWPKDVRASLTVRMLDDPMLSDVWGERLTRIDLDVTARTSLQVTVERYEVIDEDEA
ncbi:MAG: hypothetical protein Q8Q19_09200, partial [Microbacterium sp.]|nr:hypothetical protein [Microbacterium sp.]